MSETTAVATVDLKEFTEQQVQKFKPYDAQIAELRSKGAALNITGPDDADGYKAVFEFRQGVKRLRIDVEKMRKEITDDAHKFKKAVDEEGRRIREALEGIEQPLQLMEDAYEQQRKDRANAKAEAERAKQRERVEALLKNDMVLHYGIYVLENSDLSIDGTQIALMSDEVFGNFLKAVEAIAIGRRFKRDRYHEREKKLFALGMTWDGNEFNLGEQSLSSSTVAEMDDEQFADALALVKHEDDRLEMEAIKQQEKSDHDRKLADRKLALYAAGAVIASPDQVERLVLEPGSFVVEGLGPVQTVAISPAQIEGDTDTFEQVFKLIKEAGTAKMVEAKRQNDEVAEKKRELDRKQAELDKAEADRKRNEADALYKHRLSELALHGAEEHCADRDQVSVKLGKLLVRKDRLVALDDEQFGGLMVNFRDERQRLNDAKAKADQEAEQQRVAKQTDREKIQELVGMFEADLLKATTVRDVCKSAIAKQGMKAVVEQLTHTKSYVASILKDL